MNIHSMISEWLTAKLIKSDFDLVVPFDKNNDTTKILNDIMAAFKKYDESLNVVVTLEHSFI